MIYTIANYFDYVGDNYLKIKDNFTKILYSQHIKFDEDVFHNTIYNCYNTLTNSNLSFNYENELLSYLFSAFKMNIFRDKKYACHKNKSLGVIHFDISEVSDIELVCDENMIQTEIEHKFGTFMCDIYYENISGTSIIILQDKYHIKNLKAKLKEIRNFVKEKMREK